MSADSVPPILPGPPPAAPSSTAAPASDAAPGEFAALVAGPGTDASAKPAAPTQPQGTQAQDGKPAADAPSADGKALSATPGALTLQLVPTAAAEPAPGAPEPPVAATLPPAVNTAQPKPAAATAKDSKPGDSKPGDKDEKLEDAPAADTAPPQAAALHADTRDAPPAATQHADAKDQQPAQDSAPPAQPDPTLAAQIALTPSAQARPSAPATDQTHNVLAAPARKPAAALQVDPSTETTQAPVKTTNAVGQRAARVSEGKGALSAATAQTAADTSTPARAADPLASSIPAPPSAAPASATPASPHGAQLAPAGLAVAQEIVRRFDGGNTSFQLRLDPPELGRVDIRLDVSRDKKVTATISADNPATLSDLRNSSRELQRALTDSGLDLADNGLSFSDRRDSAPASFAQTQLRGTSSPAESEATPAPTPARPLGVQRWGGAGVDLWA